MLISKDFIAFYSIPKYSLKCYYSYINKSPKLNFPNFFIFSKLANFQRTFIINRNSIQSYNLSM